MERGLTLFINLVGGFAVLGSYAWGLSSHPGEGALLWGDIPESWKPLYSLNMLPAALGYLTFTAYLLSAKPEELRFRGEKALVLFQINYGLFLTTAAFWMPLCWIALDGNQTWLLLPIQSVLAVTGLASIGFIYLLWNLEAPPRPRFHKAALVGACWLALQCAVLDAIVWPRFFHL